MKHPGTREFVDQCKHAIPCSLAGVTFLAKRHPAKYRCEQGEHDLRDCKVKLVGRTVHTAVPVGFLTERFSKPFVKALRCLVLTK